MAPTARFLARANYCCHLGVLPDGIGLEVEMPRTKDVTERESYIIAKALYERKFLRV